MGGYGSGRRIQSSDEDKKARGVFRADRSEEAVLSKKVAKLFVGPWLTEIPEPELPLGEVGRAKYFELTRALKEQGKLSKPLIMRAEMAAMMWEKIHDLKARGEYPSGSDQSQLQRALDALDLANKATPIDNPDKKNKFEGHGWANKKKATFRLLPPSAA